MSDPRHALGSAAEAAVAEWLARQGWSILARRVRAGAGGEVDLIGLDPDRTLVAVEVRARRSARTGAAAATLDFSRVRRLEATLVAHPVARTVRHSGLRIDLVTVEPVGQPSERRWRLRRIPALGGK